MFPESNTVNAELIYPATEKLIAKYTEQQMYYVEETEEIYNNVTKPYIDR